MSVSPSSQNNNPLWKSPFKKVESNSVSISTLKFSAPNNVHLLDTFVPLSFLPLPPFAISNTFSWHPWQNRIVSFLIQKPKRNVILVISDGETRNGKLKNHHAGKTFLAQNFKKMFPEETVILKCAKKLEMQVVAEQSPNRKVVFLDRQGVSAQKKLPKSAYRAIEEFQKEIPTHFVIFSQHELNYNLFPNHSFLVMKLYPLSSEVEFPSFSWTEELIEKTYSAFTYYDK